MSRRSSLDLRIAALLLAAFLSGSGLHFLFRHAHRTVIDLSKGSIATLDGETKKTLASLQAPIKLTYFTSEKKRMPTAMRRMEPALRSLLREMKRYGGQHYTYEVVYPEDVPQVARGLGRFGLTSFQYKTILKDEYSVDTIWSGIMLEYKGQTRTIPYLTPSHLPNLEGTIITHIRNIDTDYKPFVAVSAPKDYQGLRSMIASESASEARDFSFAQGEGLPPEADAAFIVQPQGLSAKDVNAIDLFLRSGKDIFISYSNYKILPAPGGYLVSAQETGLEEYLADKGVLLNQALLCEQNSRDGIPFLAVVQSAQVVTTGMRLLRSGEMTAPLASPITFDMVKMKKNGIASDTLIFSSVDAWSVPFSEGEQFISRDGLLRGGQKASRAATLAAVVFSDKPWEGKLYLYASGSLFSDSAGSANQLYLKNIFMSFLRPEKMNSISMEDEAKRSLPPLSSPVRAFWRFTVIFLIPAAGLFLLIFNVSRFHKIPVAARMATLLVAGGFFAGTIAIVLLVSLFRFAASWSHDFTAGSVNSISPLTFDRLRAMDKRVTLRYFVSPSADMPVSLKNTVSAVTEKLHAMERASGGRLSVAVETVREQQLADTGFKKRLERFRIEPFKIRLIEHDRYVEKMAYSGLVFEEEDGRFETVPHLTQQNADRIEFVVVSAIKRLREQKKPTIAFVADLPHLTAGEFWELQQLEVQIQPKSEDVYAQLLSILHNDGYDVRLYNSKDKNAFSEDLLLYLQPWTVSDGMKKEFNRFLRSGKNVLLAVQHFKMQARKYSGRAYEIAYWPQPQFSRVNELLEPYGIELAREVFFDQSKAPMDTKEQLRWGAYKRYEKRAPDAQPFIIRAIAPNFDAKSPITSRLSDILFIWGNRWQRSKSAFPDTLAWRPLISSTEDCWALDWKGGFLSEDILHQGAYFDVKQPLVVMAEGVFPPLAPGADNDAKPSKLLLIGSSKLFENEQLDSLGYDHEKFILNAVADLAYGSELARIQASGKAQAKGIPFIEPSRKLLWRSAVIGLAPLFFLFYGLYRRRRNS